MEDHAVGLLRRPVQRKLRFCARAEGKPDGEVRAVVDVDCHGGV